MATSFGNSEAFWLETEDLINISFDRIITKVNERRILVLAQLRDIKNLKSEILKSINQIENTKLGIENEMTENRLLDSKEKTIADLNKKISLLQIDACNADADYQFVFEDKEFRRALSILGAIEKTPIHYLTKKHPQSVIPIEKYESKYGRLSVNEELGLIAVNNTSENQIIYFNLEGKRLNSFELESCPGICAIELIDHLEIVMSDIPTEKVLLIQFNPLAKTNAKILSETKKLEYIASISYDKYSNLIYAICSTKRCLDIFDRNLALIKIIQTTYLFPQRIFVAKEEIYILDCRNPCLHILSKSTYQTTRSILPMGNGLSLNNTLPFSIDKDGNIIIANYSGDNTLIQIYSPSGQLLHSFHGEHGISNTVFVTSDYKIIVLSNNHDYPLQIF